MESDEEAEKRIKEMWDYISKDGMGDASNPKVPVTLIYTGSHSTPAAIHDTNQNIGEELNDENRKAALAG